MMKFCLAACFLLSGTLSFAQHVKINDTHIRYSGRIGMKKEFAEFYWSGSSATLRFKGTGVSADLKDERADNYFYVVIDRDSTYKLKVDSVKKTYQLAADLPKGNHQVELFKITEYDRERPDFMASS
ncbi:hypothetical protein GS399_05705 [Pedobacter sp. HMF7647]|uniref:Carbohydrate esterase 2 N-terminal domain-containing protein n=1 Tax=Hufsiella arboris TaxID=2695275 RepID=A0A7K1Y7W6_9SPHI|nr:hypothetical protein [Hufsiella arboris]MXV50461.1 hypothetical protein [Hufsiella arboris]